MPLNAWDQIEEKASKLRAREPSLTKEQAMVQVLSTDKDLARQYSEQRAGINRELALRREFGQINARVAAKMAQEPPFGSALRELNAKARDRAADNGVSFAVAFTEVLAANPTLARRYTQERGETGRSRRSW